MKETVRLSSSIQYVKGVGPQLAKLLKKKGIETLEDALYFLPRTYEDRRRIQPIASVVPGQTATVVATVVSARAVRQGRRSVFEANLSDGTGAIQLYWFHAYPSLTAEFQPGKKFCVYGEVKFFRQLPQIVHPEYEPVREGNEGKPVASASFGRVVPVYSETEGLHQKTVRKLMGEVLRMSMVHLDDPLPETLREKLRLPTLRDSFVSIHFPKEFPEEGQISEACRRVIFEEFFVLQLGLGLRKRKQRSAQGYVCHDEAALARFAASLPFPLTGDQKKSLESISVDLASGKPMTRLVQGDVGSGKTVVGFGAAVLAASSGLQTAFMAPTEILAVQHLKTAEKFLKPLGIECQLVVSSNSAKKEVREAVSSARAKFVVGTHALFQQKIQFQKLGLVIVDEQHRFGVEQRTELVKKGEGTVPHLLMMTATPIPRTLAFTLYGDLDLTVIREKPAGRQPVKTVVIRDRDRPRLYQKIRQTVEAGEQVYIIYPLIEASEKLDLKSATEMFQKLGKEVFPQFKLALLHGKMKSEDKDRILAEFKARQYQILVSTTVIEVGIDIPNATLMVIEHPDRLGLSQLHQLRGRVGRGSAKSDCILIVDNWISPRLRVMEQSEDGFVIAEEDLKIRGPGEFLGTRQSGLPGFRVGHILRDAELLSTARDEAMRIIEVDPTLALPENKGVRLMVESRWREKIERLGS